MTHSKLYKFARSLSGLLEHFDSPQVIYEQLLDLMDSQKEYFLKIGPETVIKLIFLIYSYNKTKDFQLGETMINNLLFLKVINNTTEEYEEECDSCSGSGYIECDYCHGNGHKNCDDCDGTGKMECSDCEGSGKGPDGSDCDMCEASGEVDCEKCDGSGEIDCEECGGIGREDCADCDSRGVLGTDETYGKFSCVITWDSKMVEKSEITVGTLEPLYIESEDTTSKYFLITFSETVNMEFEPEMDYDEFYCAYTQDSPKLTFSYNMRILWGPDFFEIFKNYEKGRP